MLKEFKTRLYHYIARYYLHKCVIEKKKWPEVEMAKYWPNYCKWNNKWIELKEYQVK
jgi:hypothetical protein